MPFSVKVENLTKSFGDRVIIDKLSLTIHEGEIVVFQGPSGIGKSTFLRCLTYLEPFQDGIVQIGEFMLRPGMKDREDRQHIRAVRGELGFVFQFFNLFPHLTVMENLTLAPIKVLKHHPSRAAQEALELLRRVDLAEKKDAYPASLSGGQSQRVAIARALAMRPKALLLDEPTSSLDPERKEEVVEVIEEFSREGLTMLIVTHEPAFVERIATRLIKFGGDGKILSDNRRA